MMSSLDAQLREWARSLGQTVVAKAKKSPLVAQLQTALGTLADALPVSSATAERPAADGAHRFELGRTRDGTEPEHIPWTYGQDRVTAAFIDPDRLYVYWEVTDDAIAQARDGLGRGGPDAWLDLRVYDVTGRLFDGTNAHSYVDQRVERTDRQWFFDIGRPDSSATVEIGLRSAEGYFVRIARSGRVDFPRREPAPPGNVEWLTVRPGHTTDSVAGSGPAASAAPARDAERTPGDAVEPWNGDLAATGTAAPAPRPAAAPSPVRLGASERRLGGSERAVPAVR